VLTISFVKDRPSQVNKIGSRHPKYEWRVGVLEVGAILDSDVTCTITVALSEQLGTPCFDDRIKGAATVLKRRGDEPCGTKSIHSQVKSIHKQQTTIRKPIECAPEASSGGLDLT
jgi:hypothetical protein